MPRLPVTHRDVWTLVRGLVGAQLDELLRKRT